MRALLADHRASTGKEVQSVSDEAMAILLDYDWPGNVRELRNALEYAVVRCRATVIGPDDLPPELLEKSLRIILEHDSYRERVVAWDAGLDAGEDLYVPDDACHAAVKYHLSHSL